MTVISKQTIRRDVSHAAPYGNVWAKRFVLATDAGGNVIDGDSRTAPVAGDVVRIGWLPAGIELHDVQVVVSAPLTGVTALKLGFAYEDDKDSALLPQDDSFFFSALDSGTAARTRWDGSRATTVLPRAAYVIATLSGTSTGAGRVDVIVSGINQGYA